MLALVLFLSVSQVAPPTPQPQPGDTATVATRAAWSGAAGLVGAGAGLGISLLFSFANPSFDAKFATSALSALLIAAAVVTVHEALGGRGEIVFAIVCSLGIMALSGVLAEAMDGGVPKTPILIAAMGAVPASALSVLVLEASSPKPKSKVQVLATAGGLVVTF